MDAASRLGVRTPRPASWAIALAAAGVAVGAFILSGRGGTSTPTVPAPSHIALVYAKPVGKRFIAHRELIYSASSTDQHPLRLAVGTNPILSPDGRWVAYVGGPLDHPTGLRLISTRGGTPRVVGISGEPLVWSWSWDSRLIAVQGAHGLVIVDARSRRTTPIRLPDGSWNFSFSPDGTMLAFEHSTGTGSDIYTVTISAGAIHKLTDDGRSGYPLWGPGGIAFQRYGAGRCCHGDVWLMSGSGGDAHQLTHTRAGIYPAAWSADGSRMLAAYPATNNGKLYAVDVASGAARPLTPFVGDLYAQGLSRNGRTVLAAIGCGELATPYGLVETIPFTGGHPTVLVRGPCRASSNF